MGATWKVLPVVSLSEHLCTMSISLTLKHKPCLCNLALQPSWWLNGVLLACQMRVLHGVMVIYPLSLRSKVYYTQLCDAGPGPQQVTFLLCHHSFWVLPVGGARGSLDGRKRKKGLAAPGTLVVAVGSGFQRVWTLPEPSSSYLLGGMSTSQSDLSPKRSKSRLPDPMGSFLWDSQDTASS